MSSGPIWTRPEPGERRAALTRDQIAVAAVALADAEGPKALSMRRLAQELGVGTMTLYGYVRTKQDLFALIDDTLMGGLLVPEEEFPDGDWRAALTAIAGRSRASFEAHPWILEAMGMMGSRIGPNAMRHFDQTVRAVRALDLDPVEKFELTSLVDEYVFGYALRAATDLDTTAPDVFEDIKRYVEAQLETGEYPHIEALLPPGPAREDIWRRLGETERDSRRFERGLKRLLDGIEAELTERGVL